MSKGAPHGTPFDQLNKASHYPSQSAPRQSLGRGSRVRLGGQNRFRLGSAVNVFHSSLSNIDAAFEIGSIFDADTLAGHVSGQRSFITDVGPVAGNDVAFDLAQDYHFLGGNVGLDLAVTPDGDAVPLQVDRAFH